MKRVCLFCGIALLTMIVYGNEAKDYLKSVVFIESGDSRGTGFVCDIDGNQYVITIEHVARGGKTFRVYTIGGERVRCKSFEVAKNLDLVRCSVDTARSRVVSLELSNNVNIEDKVTVLGNSDGAGVITKIQGKVLGVGSDRIEVDADFIKGNSGSPIVNAEGKVIGVATYALLMVDNQDWAKRGTRFENVRRFGLRIEKAQWEKIEWKEYCQAANLLNIVDKGILALSEQLDVSYEEWAKIPIKTNDVNDNARLYRMIQEVNKKESAYRNKLQIVKQIERNMTTLCPELVPWTLGGFIYAVKVPYNGDVEIIHTIRADTRQMCINGARAELIECHTMEMYKGYDILEKSINDRVRIFKELRKTLPKGKKVSCLLQNESEIYDKRITQYINKLNNKKNEFKKAMWSEIDRVRTQDGFCTMAEFEKVRLHKR